MENGQAQDMLTNGLQPPTIDDRTQAGATPSPTADERLAALEADNASLREANTGLYKLLEQTCVSLDATRIAILRAVRPR